MAIEVKMPRLSLTMESGVVLQWLKAEGDAVAKGDDLAELETDKTNVVMEAPAGGYVRRLLVGAGITVPCDTVVALLTATADEPLDGTQLSGAQPSGSADGQSGLTAEEDVVSSASGGLKPAHGAASQSAVPPAALASAGRAHLNASPAAKNLARQLGVDLATVPGTGPAGRIGLEDVQRAADARTAAPPVPSGDRRLPLSRMRAAIAARMTASATTVPQFTVRRRVDMTAALRLLAAIPDVSGARGPGVIDVLHLAAVRALGAHPEVNASFEPGTTLENSHILQHSAVNLGVAVALPEGLVVPVIRDAQKYSLAELAAERARLQEEARAGRLAARSLSAATFTVSNLGTLGADEFTAIVNPPEAAILAVGRMGQELVVRDGAIHTLPMIALTVTADHRVLDGAAVARFLETLSCNLEHPEEGTEHGT